MLKEVEKMKKVLFITAVVLVFFLTTGIASARVFFRFGFFPPAVIGPPVVVAPPPAYYPYPDGYYGPGYYGYRAWVPGYWDNIWTSYGWEKVWHPGHWEYRP
jgi:hypothetical protein